MNNLTKTEIRALDDKYRSWATYDQVIADFGEVPPFSNIRVAEARVAAEIANGEMYERLLGLTLHSDILTVLRNLQKVSQYSHLPAFQRCMQDSAGDGGARHHRGECQSSAPSPPPPSSN